MENTVKERIKLLRNKVNISQQQMASDIGITTTTLSRIESGLSAPRKSTLNAIIEKYSISKEWLLEGTGEVFVLPGQSQKVEKSDNIWKDALVSQLKDENMGLREQVKMMMQTIVNLSSQGKTSFPNAIEQVGQMFNLPFNSVSVSA